MVRDLVWVPFPQVTEQSPMSPHSDNSQSTENGSHRSFLFEKREEKDVFRTEMFLGTAAVSATDTVEILMKLRFFGCRKHLPKKLMHKNFLKTGATF